MTRHSNITKSCSAKRDPRGTNLSLWLLLVVIGASVPAMGEEERASGSNATDEGYDQALATRLGADEYGMRRYVMAFLRAGPNRSQNEQAAAELQRAHLDNIHRLASEGKLALAGPFLDDGELRGIYVFNVSTVEEARELTETDPAISAGIFVMELHPWYGSAALLEVNDIGLRIARKQI
jgi:uncharacterized protein YciI